MNLNDAYLSGTFASTKFSPCLFDACLCFIVLYLSYDSFSAKLAFLITYIWWWYLQDRLQERLRKSKRLILEEAAKNKGFDLGNGELFY